MDELAKYFLLILLSLPFAALATDTLGRTEDLMIKTVLVVATLSGLIVLMMGGLHQRPNVANLIMAAFLAWPVALLVAKGINPALSWGSMWFSVPVMSWYLVNLSLQFYYPTSGTGGGFGAMLALVAGWLYMVIPFALLSSVFVAGRMIIRRIRSD